MMGREVATSDGQQHLHFTILHRAPTQLTSSLVTSIPALASFSLLLWSSARERVCPGLYCSGTAAGCEGKKEGNKKAAERIVGHEMVLSTNQKTKANVRS